MKKHQKQLLYIIAILTIVGVTITLSQNPTNFKGSLRDVRMDDQRYTSQDEVKDTSSTQDVQSTTDKYSYLRIDNDTLKDNIVTAGTYELLRFNLTALKEKIVFNKAPSNTYQPSDSLISVVLKGNVAAGNIARCTLTDVMGGRKLDTIDLSSGKGVSLVENGSTLLDFNFYDNGLTISHRESKKLSVVCDLTLTAGESISAMVSSTIVPTNDIVDDDDADDNDDDAIEPGALNYTLADPPQPDKVGSTLADPPGVKTRSTLADPPQPDKATLGLPVMGPMFVGSQL